MDVLLDNKQVDAALVGGRTLEEALRILQSEVCEPGQVVVSLRCDGESILANEMSEALGKSAAEFDKLEVFTSTKDVLVSEAMAQARAAISQTYSECESIADLLTEGKTAEGVQALGDCLRVWQQVHQAVAQSIQMLQIDMDTTFVGDEPLAELIVRPKNVLLSIKEALKSTDHVVLADIMRYEFSTVIDQWQEIIAMLSRRADELQGEG